MNYIKKMQQELKDSHSKEEKVQGFLQDFQAHLQSEKFSGEDVDGSRKDWIATQDVLNWLSNLQTILSE